MKTILSIIVGFFVAFIFYAGKPLQPKASVIARGQMPNAIKDKNGKLHLVFGSGDSILYSFSSDGGDSFSAPELISLLPKLTADHTRGPQIAATTNGLIVTACNRPGNIYSFIKKGKSWQQTGKVNDRDTVAKENLMALSADGMNAFAVWLDLRDRSNKIFGARSVDGGKTWSKNILVYASPDKTVCQCCKPSVVVKGNEVYVMFRNWLDGNRDLYLSHSTNGGQSFSIAEKIGVGNWPLNGCPMDGGALALNNEGKPVTVWNRKGTIYSCVPGSQEVQIGMGRSCSLESIGGKNVFAWVENGEVVFLNTDGKKMNLGKGQLPIIKAVDNNHAVCLWENEKQIFRQVIDL